MDPLNITKLRIPSQHSILGYHRHASETPFKFAFRWRANDGPLIVVLDPRSLTKKRRRKKDPVKYVLQRVSYPLEEKNAQKN